MLKKVLAFFVTMTFALSVISLLPEEYLNCISASAEGIIVLDAGTTPAEELTIIKTGTTDLMNLELKELYYKYNTYYSEMDVNIRINFDKLNMQNEEVHSYVACASLSYSDDGISYSDSKFWGCSEINPYQSYTEIQGYIFHKTTNLHKYYCYDVGYGYALLEDGSGWSTENARKNFVSLFKVIVPGEEIAKHFDIAQADFSGGNGTPESPYLISNVLQLNNVRNDLSASYKLVADIDVGGSWTGFGNSTSDAFTGTFDGDGHVISGITEIPVLNRSSAGFFYYAVGANIKNLTYPPTNPPTRHRIKNMVK